MSEERKARAKAWFEELRDRLCAAFEAIEDEAAGLEIYGPGTPGRFERTAWTRPTPDQTTGGGGVRST